MQLIRFVCFTRQQKIDVDEFFPLADRWLLRSFRVPSSNKTKKSLERTPINSKKKRVLHSSRLIVSTKSQDLKYFSSEREKKSLHADFSELFFSASLDSITNRLPTKPDSTKVSQLVSILFPTLLTQTCAVLIDSQSAANKQPTSARAECAQLSIFIVSEVAPTHIFVRV